MGTGMNTPTLLPVRKRHNYAVLFQGYKEVEGRQGALRKPGVNRIATQVPRFRIREVHH